MTSYDRVNTQNMRQSTKTPTFGLIVLSEKYGGVFNDTTCYFHCTVPFKRLGSVQILFVKSFFSAQQGCIIYLIINAGFVNKLLHFLVRLVLIGLESQ